MKKKINAATARTIHDLLNQIPGLKASGTSISIRGSVKVLVLLDGRSINDPTSNTGGVRWDVVDLAQVRQIAILRGNGGVEYGDNASGGVVDIHTRKIDTLQGSLEAKAGNQDIREVNGSVRQTFGDLGLGLNGGYYDTTGFRPNDDERKRRIETRMNYDTGHAPENRGPRHFIMMKKRAIPGCRIIPRPGPRGKTRWHPAC